MTTRGRMAMHAVEQALSQQMAANVARQAAAEQRARWATMIEVVDPAELPEDRASVFFATVDTDTATSAVGLVRAGTFFTVPPHLAGRFRASRTLLAASRAALRQLEALRDELLAAGKTTEAELVDLRPVRLVAGVRVMEAPREPRLADDGNEGRR